MRPLFCLLSIVCLLLPLTGKSDPVISEFMASNKHTLNDEDGDASDWLEVRNPDSVAVNMAGWFLTDKATNLTQWAFPAVVIPPKGCLLVWCSSKDRRIVGQPLHTNFDLKAAGEYLALVKPDGVSKSTEFSPAFPAQYQDISYGTSLTTTTTTLVAAPGSVRAFVPADNALGTAWRAPAFNDSTWLSGGFPVGFMNYGKTSTPDLQSTLVLDLKSRYPAILGTGRSVFLRTHFTVPDVSKVERLTLNVNYDDGFFAWINGTAVAASKAPAESALVYNSAATADHTPGAYESFEVSSLLGSLVTGDNVLALDSLNVNAGSSDLYCLPQLVAGVSSGTPEMTGYFSAPTPGLPNGGVSTIVLPQTVTPSRASGTFTATFGLTLSGAATGQQIRYILAAPTAATGANVPDPTLSSTLYSGAISISSSSVIRAAVFNPTNGQKGPTVTLQFLLLETAASNNSSNYTSALPIIVADDHGAGQPIDSDATTFPANTVDGKTVGLFYVFNPSATGVSSLTTQPNVFTRAGLAVRGSSSTFFPKKSYSLETRDEQNKDLKFPLLGLANGSDWALIAAWYYDPTYIHNAYVYELSRRLGHWAPRISFAEMFSNINGVKLDYADYVGIYAFTERIKSNSNLLDITSLDPGDTSGDALTGGYIFKIDRADNGEITWRTANGVPIASDGTKLIFVEPGADDATPEQISYLQNYVQAFDTTLFSEKATGFKTRNYLNYINRASWIDYHILDSLSYNDDGLRLSSYFYKDRGGKIEAGPAWDYDRALGSKDGRDANPRGWTNIEYYFTRDWWGQLFQDPDFVQAWIDRWQQLRQGTFSDANLNTVADSVAAQIPAASAARDVAKWPDNSPGNGGNFQTAVAAMKTWLTSNAVGSLGRTNWIDSQLPAAPTASLASGVVSPGTFVSLGAPGTIQYTINGTDPRASGGGTSSFATTYNGALSINQTTVVTARQFGSFTPFPGAASTNWGGVVTRVYLVNEAFAVAGDLAVSEIQYDPLGPSAAEAVLVPTANASDFEFIELRNVGTRQINTFEVGFADGAPFTALQLSARTLAPGERALVVKNRAAFIARYGGLRASQIIGEWGTGSLSNDGETITILARDGSVIQSLTYGTTADWPARAHGVGSSLEYVGTSFDAASFAAPGNWRSSAEIHGSPGYAGTGPDGRLVINEILSHSNTPRVDAIELYNPTLTVLDIGGWLLGDAKSPDTADGYMQYRIPSGTVVPALGYKVFTEADFNPNGSWNPSAGPASATEFAYDAHHGDRAWVIQTDAGGNPAKFIDDYTFGAAPSDESFGRWPNGTGNFYPMQQRTLLNEDLGIYPRPGLGAANGQPRVGPLVISEVQHSPINGNTDLEFIEIRNTGTANQSLAHWQMLGGVTFAFGDTDALAAGALLVVVPFSPTDATKAPAFRTAYGISSNVKLVGPWSKNDHLGSSGNIVLYRADAPSPDEPSFYPLLIEDQTAYANGSPWPNAASGFSLNRRGSTLVGDAANGWKADVPSPGSLGPVYAQWKAYYFPNGGAGTGDNEDYDQDGLSNWLEYAQSTNPLVFDPARVITPTLMRSASGGNGSYTFTFTKPIDRPGAVYQAQQSSNLINWSNVADTLVSTNLDVETHAVTLPFTGNNPPAMFFRVNITGGSGGNASQPANKPQPSSPVTTRLLK